MSVTERSLLEERWGIRIEGLRLTAGGYMIDFRYRVLDAEKARPLLDRKVAASLFDLKTGTKLSVPSSPKIGALRSKTSEGAAGRTFFIIFTNPGQLVKAGDHARVSIGEFHADNITVE